MKKKPLQIWPHKRRMEIFNNNNNYTRLKYWNAVGQSENDSIYSAANQATRLPDTELWLVDQLTGAKSFGEKRETDDQNKMELYRKDVEI